MSKKLTPLQSRFVDWYLITWNGVKSAKLAGYRGDYNTLGVVAHENLKKPKIKAEIEQRLNEHAMSANEVLARLAGQARGDLGEFSDIEKQEDLGDHPKSYLVKEITTVTTETKYGTNTRFRLELHNSQRALQLIGQYHQLFTEKDDSDAREINITFKTPDWATPDNDDTGD